MMLDMFYGLNVLQCSELVKNVGHQSLPKQILFYHVRIVTKSQSHNASIVVPPMAPKRQMITSIADDRPPSRLRFLGGFRVLSYNVLAEIYATRQMYPYCPMWALNWSFRKQLLQRELQLYNADILCLQVTT